MTISKLTKRNKQPPLDDPASLRLKRSRRTRALEGHRRVDVMLSPQANAALQRIISARECTAKDAIEIALVAYTKGTK